MNANRHTEATLRNAIRHLRDLADWCDQRRAKGECPPFSKDYYDGVMAGLRSGANRIEETFLPKKKVRKGPFLGVVDIAPKKPKT